MPDTLVNASEVDMHSRQDVRPIPDPTYLTNQAVNAAVSLMRREADAQKEYCRSQLEGAVQVMEFRFSAIAMQLTERDMRFQIGRDDGKAAIESALAAQKQLVDEQNKSNSVAVAKAEAATTKQIDQIYLLITTMKAAVDDQLNDAKGRVTAIEAHGSGIKDGWGYLVGLIGVVVAFVALFWKH